MQTNIKVLEHIKDKLKRGDIQKIADKTGFSRQYVGLVLSSQSDTYNEIVVNEAVKIIETREQITQKLLKKLSALPL